MRDAALFLSEAREHMSQLFRSIPADIAQEVASNEVEQRTQQTEDASAAESESTDESDQDFLRAANSATIPAGSAEPVGGNFASQMAAHGAATPASAFLQHCGMTLQEFRQQPRSTWVIGHNSSKTGGSFALSSITMTQLGNAFCPEQMSVNSL